MRTVRNILTRRHLINSIVCGDNNPPVCTLPCYLNDVVSDLKVSEWHHHRKLSYYLFPFPGTKQLQHLGTPAFHTSTERGWNACLERPRRTLTESCVLECFLSITEDIRTSNIPWGYRWRWRLGPCWGLLSSLGWPQGSVQRYAFCILKRLLW